MPETQTQVKALRRTSNSGGRTPHIFHRPDPDDPSQPRCPNPGSFKPVDPDAYPENFYRWCRACTEEDDDG